MLETKYPLSKRHWLNRGVKSRLAGACCKCLTETTTFLIRSFEVAMLHAMLVTLAITALSCAISKGVTDGVDKSCRISGVLTTTHSYCGGAAPTPEMEAWYRAQRPYQCSLYVRLGPWNDPTQPLIDSTYSDSLGRFSFLLPPGDYTLITAEQRDIAIVERIVAMQTKYVRVDASCVSEWFEAGLFQLHAITSDTSNLNHNFHKRCFVPYSMVCLKYMGPYPP